jgi:steroid delta-isomerase
VSLEDRIRAAVDRHVAGVAAADADPLAALYAEDGFFEDPAGGQRHIGRDAVRRHFAAVPSKSPHDVRLLSLAVVGQEVALLFRAVSRDGSATVTEVFDVMSFDEDARITANRAYWPAERPV